MTAEAARQALVAAVSAGGEGLSNFLIRGDSLAQGRTTRFDFAAEMAAEVVTDVRAAATGLVDKQFLDYDPSYQTNTSQVLVENLSEIPELAVVDAAIRVGDLPLDDGGATPVAMVHAVGVGTHQVVAYRLKGPGIATRRPRGIPILPRAGVYRPLDGEILFYDNRFDSFTCGGFAYFTAVSLIQSKLQAPDKARQLARTTLTAVTVNVRIDGFAALEQAVMDDPTLRAKMASVARLIDNDPQYATYLTTDKLIAFVEAHPDYNIPVTTDNGIKSLRFDPSSQHRHQIPRLLADDYLHSYLTGRNYEAGSKQRVRTQP